MSLLFLTLWLLGWIIAAAAYLTLQHYLGQNVKLLLLSDLFETLGDLHAGMIRLTQLVAKVRERVWVASTAENLRTVNTRQVGY